MEQTICSCKYCCKAKERHQFESVLLVPASTGYASYAIIQLLLLSYLMLSCFLQQTVLNKNPTTGKTLHGFKTSMFPKHSRYLQCTEASKYNLNHFDKLIRDRDDLIRDHHKSKKGSKTSNR
jgi:hypothetical protein